jgi:hypothetical protein
MKNSTLILTCADDGSVNVYVHAYVCICEKINVNLEYIAETGTLWTVRSEVLGRDLKCGAGEGWGRSVEHVCVKNEILHRVQVERNILHTIKGRKAIWIGHILHRNCLLKHVI